MVAWCLLVFLLPVNFGFELVLIGNIIAIPAFLDRFGQETATGAIEISARDQQVLNTATTVDIFVAAFAAGFIADKIGRRKNTMIVVGQWSCALVGYGGSFINNDWRWRMPILSQLLPPILMVVLGKILLPESPSWLVLHGQHEKAIAALRKFNSPNYDAAAAVAVLEAAVQRERTLQSESHPSGNALRFCHFIHPFVIRT
ncbi:unnamed protein product [Alternaria alternata]